MGTCTADCQKLNFAPRVRKTGVTIPLNSNLSVTFQYGETVATGLISLSKNGFKNFGILSASASFPWYPYMIP